AVFFKSQFSLNIKFITCGTLQFRDGKKCRNCGKKTPFFQEKGVDVKMAVDIVTDSLDPKLEKIVLVSSDSDLLPAIKQVNQRGKEVEYVFADNKLNWGIVHNSTKKHNISKNTVTEGYTKANK
ncbi:MAG: NYN domain-containing protein, partial [Patescibacteria group bacterium]